MRIILIFLIKISNDYIERKIKMETLQKSCLVLTIIGAIVWGIIGLFNVNIVEALFGDTIIPRIIYSLVGIAGLINIGLLFNHIETK